MDPFQAKVISAAIGSIVTGLTMTPFDVIKTRLQTQPAQQSSLPFPQPPNGKCCQQSSMSCVRRMSSLARPLPQDLVCVWEQGILHRERVSGFWDAVRHVWKAEGLRGLWKGAGTTLVIGVPSSICYMLTYDHLLRVALPPISPHTSFTPLFAGIMSRCMISSIVSPLELIRTNLQSTPTSGIPHTLKSVLTSIRGLVRQQGLSSLWRGLGPTLWRDVPFSGIYWANYETWKGFLEARTRHRVAVAFTSGAISGITAALVTHPFDVLKTRRQSLIMSTGMAKNHAVSSLSVLVDILRKEGGSSLFAGVIPRTAKIAPACGIMISCYEGFGRLLTQ